MEEAFIFFEEVKKLARKRKRERMEEERKRIFMLIDDS